MRETSGLELASTITLVLQANRLTKCASHPLFHLNVFFINQHQYMPKEKYIEQKKQRFDDLTFSMTLFCAKKSKNWVCWVRKKTETIK